MQVVLELPEDLAPLFGEDPAGLSRAALEALTLEGLRCGKLTEAQARRLLGIQSRYLMDGFLKAHDIMLPLTLESLQEDAEIALRHRSK